MKINSPSFLLVVSVLKKLQTEPLQSAITTCNAFFTSLDKSLSKKGIPQKEELFFENKKEMFYKYINTDFNYDNFIEWDKDGSKRSISLKDGLASYLIWEDMFEWSDWSKETIKDCFFKFRKGLQINDHEISPKEIYQHIKPIYKNLTEDDFLSALPQETNTSIEVSNYSFEESLVGSYFSYISYQGLPRRQDKEREGATFPEKKVVKAVWKMEMEDYKEGRRLKVTRKGLGSNKREGYLERQDKMIYIHLSDAATEEYTVYTSRKTSKINEIKCNRIYAPEDKPFVFKEILLKQEKGFGTYNKHNTKLITWKDEDLNEYIKSFISYPIKPFYNDLKSDFKININSLKGIWKIYFWQRNGAEHRIRTCYMIITGQFNIRYNVPGFIYWHGYLQGISGSKFSLVFMDKTRHSIFNFELENISDLKNLSIIIAGYTVSGAEKINSGIAVLQKLENNVEEQEIDDPKFEHKDISLTEFIKDKDNHSILSHIPQPEFNIEVSHQNYSFFQEWYFGDWLLFTIDNNEKQTIHSGEFNIINNSLVVFNGSRTGFTQGRLTTSQFKDVLEIELVGNRKKGFFITKFDKDRNESIVGFVSIDTIQEEPSLGMGYLIKKEYFFSMYSKEKWELKNYEKGSDLYKLFEEKNIISKLHRLKVGGNNMFANLSSFVRNFFDEYIPVGIMKKHQIFLDNQINMLIQTAQTGKLEIFVPDKRIFSDFYKRILSSFSKGILYATSLPSKGYFWEKGNLIEAETLKFVNEGGKVYRYFYIYEEKITEEQMEIIKRHFNIYGSDDKGTVYITKMYELNETEVCDIDKIIGVISLENEYNVWEVIVSPGESGRINKLVITSDKQTYSQYMSVFNILNHSSATIKVTEEFFM